MTWDRTKPRAKAYGSAHDKARKVWAARHQPSDPCVRCGHPLGPMRPGLHLDHDDHDRSRYLGFSHGTACPTCGVKCNVVAGAQLGRARQRAARRGQPVSPPKPRAPRRWPLT